MPSFSVLLVDDDESFRLRVRQLIQRAIPEVTIGEAESADEGTVRASEQEWSVVVMDVSMPGKSGLAGVLDIRSTRPRQYVVVLSGHGRDIYEELALSVGAAAYVSKDEVAEVLVPLLVRRSELTRTL